MTKKLSKRDITKYRKTIGSAWDMSDENTALVCTFTFKHFIEAFMFVTRVSIHAEVMKQYPEILLHHCVVSLTLGRADQEMLTADNFELAKKIDVIFALSTSQRRS